MASPVIAGRADAVAAEVVVAARQRRHRPANDMTAMATVAYVGFGGNLGQPARQIVAAMQRLAAWPGVSRLRASRLYRSRPWGQTDQPQFINAVAQLHYGGSAADLMRALLMIEREAGRVRGGERWGPRILDLDLLVFADQIIDTPALTVPHPRIADRAFVLLPLAELAPHLHVPGTGPIGDLLAAVDPDGTSALDCLP